MDKKGSQEWKFDVDWLQKYRSPKAADVDNMTEVIPVRAIIHRQ